MERVTSSDDERDVSLLAEEQYFRQVRWTPDLTVEEEQDLVERIARGKAEQQHACPDRMVVEEARQARDRLVEGYQRFVVYLARQYVHRFRSLDLLDLIQEGNIGLLYAIDHEDASRGYRFSTLAGRCIRQALWSALCDRDRSIRVSNRVNDCLSKMRKVKRELWHTLGYEPSLAEIAHVMKFPQERLQEYLDLDERAEVTSLHLVFEKSGEEDDGIDRLDFVDLYASWVRVEQHQATEREQVLRCAIEGVLTEAQRQVVYLRYGLAEGEECGRSVVETAALLSKASSSVGYVEQAAKRRLAQVLMPMIGVAEELSA